MQRRLGELGTTYQDLVDGVRRQAARRLLANTDLEMGEVAFLLGFEEVNSFLRAFRVWEGATPTTWRARTRARDESKRGRRSAEAPRRAAAGDRARRG